MDLSVIGCDNSATDSRISSGGNALVLTTFYVLKVKVLDQIANAT
jgi:hypothetical protein